MFDKPTLLSRNCTIEYIASSIGRNKSTISRELSRNTVNGYYSAVAAQAVYAHRRKKCKPKIKLSDPEIFNNVREKFLEHQWSPEQISRRLEFENTDFKISYLTIYRGISAGMFDSDEERRSHGNRGKIVVSNDISERPAEAESLRRRIRLVFETL